MPKPTKPPDLVLSLDYGGSLTKSIFCDRNGLTATLPMAPHLAEVNPLQIEELEFSTTLPPQNQAWVKFNNTYYAVGHLAKERFHAQLGLNMLKSDLAIAKTLTMVWVLQRWLKLPNRFTLALVALLPPGEYEDRHRFKTKLTQALANFETPTGTLRVTLNPLYCLAEGGGILLYRGLVDPAFGNPEKTCVIAMLGFRNASLLVTKGGVRSLSKTTDLGFVQLVESVMNRTSGLTDYDALTRSIYQAGRNPASQHFRKLTRRLTEHEQAQEGAEIAKAVIAARTEYVQKLSAWYREFLPSDWSELIFCGGTAEYLSHELMMQYQKMYVEDTKAYLHGGVSLPEGFNDQGLGCRLYDPYAAFEWLVDQVAPEMEVVNG